jgi:Flp pilus assembly protein protease CpaA
MPWRDWSDYKRAQVVNAVTVPLFLVFAVSMWVQGISLWAAVFAAAAVVNTAGGLWRARQEHRKLQDSDPDNGAA